MVSNENYTYFQFITISKTEQKIKKTCLKNSINCHTSTYFLDIVINIVSFENEPLMENSIFGNNS